MIGRVIAGKYRILRRLGVGGMGEVYLARHEGMANFSKIVALKMILPHLAQTPEIVSMFTHEARIVAQLTHSNIVQVYDFGVEDGALFLVMEYVDGVSFADVLGRCVERREAFPHDLALHILSRIGSGLDYARRKKAMDGTPLNIVHRDLDPNNILLSREGEVKITDFGLVRSDVQEHLTQTGVIKGKLHYMPPEAILGEKFDHRSDIFALGVVLYEAVTGVKPFADTVQFRIMDKIRHGEYDPPEKIAPRLPPAVCDLIKRAMAHKRDDRFQDTREMNALLDALRPELWPNADAFALSTYLFDRFRIRFETDQMTGEEQEPSGITEAPLARAARLLGGGAATGETEIFEREAAAESAAPETTDTEPLSDSAFLRLAKSFQHSPARIVAVVATVIVVVAVAAALTLSRRVPSTKEAPAPAVAAVPPEPAATPVPEPTPLPVKTVTLDVVPKNATVYLDGESLGAASNLTPLTVDVGKKVTFKASAPGYVTKSVSLDAAEAAPETVKLHLAQGRGFLSVGADVGCEVYVDGANIGQTPISSYELDAGKRTVRFENAALGFTKTVPVTIKPGGTANASARYFATLMVSAVPYADVWIDGNKVGVTPYTSQQIKPGTHSVRLVNTALGKQKETYVNAQSGKTSNVSADFSQP